MLMMEPPALAAMHALAKACAMYQAPLRFVLMM